MAGSGSHLEKHKVKYILFQNKFYQLLKDEGITKQSNFGSSVRSSNMLLLCLLSVDNTPFFYCILRECFRWLHQ